jgi:hypothetical protein
MSADNLSSADKKMLKDAAQSLAETGPLYEQIGTARAKARVAMQTVLDNGKPAVKGPQTGGPSGVSPANVGTLPAKSLFPQDGAGARMTARHEIALMNLRKR